MVKGVLNPLGFESSTITIVVQQIIALKTTKSKFYVATRAESQIVNVLFFGIVFLCLFSGLSAMSITFLDHIKDIADYVLAVKGNQGRLEEDIALFFDDPILNAQCACHEQTTARSH